MKKMFKRNKKALERHYSDVMQVNISPIFRFFSGILALLFLLSPILVIVDAIALHPNVYAGYSFVENAGIILFLTFISFIGSFFWTLCFFNRVPNFYIRLLAYLLEL